MVDLAGDLELDGVSARAMRRRLAALASLLLILAAVVAALFLAGGVDRQLEDASRTYEVRKLARELLTGLIEAESAQRGYVLTEDPQYLEPYQEARATVDQRLETLLAMTADNPRQQERIGSIAEEIVLKQAEMQATIDHAAAGNIEDARRLVLSNAGLRLMAGMSGVIESFIAAEDELLVQRNQAVEGTRQALIVSVVVALIGAAALAYILFSRSQAQVAALARSRRILASANEELEAHVKARTTEAEEARERAERERQRVESLLREANHRIGNSLATVSSLLALQVMRSPSEPVKEALEAARGRVHAIAAGHRRLRLGDDLETTEAAEFLDAVADDFRTTQLANSRVVLHSDFADMVISARDATTLAILLGELVTNALKHAFPDGRAGRIWAALEQTSDGAVLTVADDGVGVTENEGSSGSGLGSVIVRQLAKQFGGTVTTEARDGGGTHVRVALPNLGDPPTHHDGTRSPHTPL